jgi:hypothetical protein
LRLGIKFLSLLAVALMCGCHFFMDSEKSLPNRDINVVLAAHQHELMAKPGVVGVYVGLMADGKTQCIKVMLSRKDSELERAIPQTIEGYTVIAEVTGEIRPLNN